MDELNHDFQALALEGVMGEVRRVRGFGEYFLEMCVLITQHNGQE